MENEFKNVMSKRTDEELVSIVTVKRDEYNPIAVEAAESEIKKRNIHTDTFEEIKEKASIEKEQKQKLDDSTVGTGVRFLNFLIDFHVWLVIAHVLTFPLNINNPTHQLIGYLIMIVTFVTYYWIMELNFQKTVGKFVFGNISSTGSITIIKSHH